VLIWNLEDEIRDDVMEQVKGSQLKKINSPDSPKQRRPTRAAVQRHTIRTALVTAIDQRRSALKEDTTPMDEEEELTSWLQ
jgi:hypothetical protein